MKAKSGLMGALAGIAALAAGASLWADTKPVAGAARAEAAAVQAGAQAGTQAGPSAASATQPAAPVNPEIAATIKRTLDSRFPGTKVTGVEQSPLPGLYEVYVGGKIYYSDASADHVIVGGSIVDTRTKTDLTDARLQELGTIDFKSLPFDKAIKIVHGNGSRQLAAFEDPDCPFCQKLEQELATIKDTTVYVFLYPIDQLHPQATKHAHEIWCAPDRAAAWTNWLTQRKPPPTASCQKDPIGDLAKLGDKLFIDGTPTMFLANGHRVGGAIPTDQLEKLLVASSGPPSTSKPGATAPAKAAASR
jgi:thiol:disulfide interchange protein DsbC